MDGFDAQREDLDVERVLRTAHFILEHASGTWFAADLGEKTQGVTLSREGFGTPKAHSLFQ